MTARAHQPRACLRCHEVKLPEAFDFGPSGRRRKGVCRECYAAEAAERATRAAARRRTWTDEQTGRVVRMCRYCKQTKDLETGYGRERGNGHYERRHICRACDSKRSVEVNRRRAEDPERREEELAKRRAWALQWRANNRERYLAQIRARRRRIMADPAARARINADARMRHRLRAEREGRTVRSLGRSRVGEIANTESERVGLLPALPLARAIERLIANDHLRLVGDDHSHAEAICEGLGIDARNYRAWISGERAEVQGDTVDRILTNAGWHWWDVYDAGTCGEEVAAKAARLLGGEEAVAI